MKRSLQAPKRLRKRTANRTTKRTNKDKEKYLRTLAQAASMLSNKLSNTSRLRQEPAMSQAVMPIPKTMTPPSRPKTSTNTSVARICDRYANSSQQECINKIFHSHGRRTRPRRYARYIERDRRETAGQVPLLVPQKAVSMRGIFAIRFVYRGRLSIEIRSYHEQDHKSPTPQLKGKFIQDEKFEHMSGPFPALA